jgi:glutamate/tyrosine decarboxylase-like PLP-dependent enzyme
LLLPVPPHDLHRSPPSTPDAVADEYAATISGSSLPKYRIPEGSSDRRAVFDLVRDELFMDGNSRQNVATFCTTYADDEVRRLMDLPIDKNMIDKDEYPQTAEIEMRCVHMLADLWHAPKSWKTTGCSTTGSSEACMLGGLALKWQWKKRRQAQGKPTDKPNFVCGPVQVCWAKFARYFDVEMRHVPLSGDATGHTPEDLAQYCDEATHEGELPPVLQEKNRKGMPTHNLLLQGPIVTVLSCCYFVIQDVSVAFFLISAMTIAPYLITYMRIYAAAIKLRYSATAL